MPYLVNHSGKVSDSQNYQHLWIGRSPLNSAAILGDPIYALSDLNSDGC